MEKYQPTTLQNGNGLVRFVRVGKSFGLNGSKFAQIRHILTFSYVTNDQIADIVPDIASF